MVKAAESYRDLEQRFARIGALREAGGVLHWDLSTMMPPGGAEARSEQLAALRVVCHELLTDPVVGDLLDAAEPETDGLEPWARANLREMRRQWRHATAVDSDLVEALSKAANRCEMIWREARPNSDFAAVLPALTELLGLVRQEAAAKAEALGCEPYDALLDQFEPGGSAARIDAIFDELAAFLPDFLDRVLARQRAAPKPLKPEGPFAAERQEALARRLMTTLGFDFAHGRLDTSLHPFCGGVPDDVRITTRYAGDDFTSALMGVLHETGHALYERGLPEAWRRQPVGDARGMTLHESQSLLIEMQASRSPEFIGYLAPLAREAFGGSGPAWETDNLIRLYHRVEPGFIRVDADEVTYPAHIILRYRLERAMLASALDPADLPGAWNEAMKELLGLSPPDDARGCLQDIHWYDGAWGYFPTYTLGALAAAQLFAAAREADPEFPAAIGRGDFAPLLAWLRAEVHGQGSRWETDELIARATGRPLEAAAFKAHLQARYLD
ncbi:MAG TPA: carboxypeptidase M32 [Kiloniellales bacterium]|nr:carboxypeptidase M32 [Kiloniellales bacterium]